MEAPFSSEERLTGSFGDIPTAEISYDSQGCLPQDFYWGNENMLPPKFGSVNNLPSRLQRFHEHSTNLGPNVLNLPYHGQWALDTGFLPASLEQSTGFPRNGLDHRHLAIRSEHYPYSEAFKGHQPITALTQSTSSGSSGPSEPFDNIVIPSHPFTFGGPADMVVDEPELPWTSRAQNLMGTAPSQPAAFPTQINLTNPQSGAFHLN